jgi:type IV pilus assembly protein PilW
MRTPDRTRGFSLVELMIAMTLSLVLLAGALSILYSSKVTNTENERIARLQEAGRTVVELILRDTRAAGFQGCARPLGLVTYENALSDPTSLLWNLQQPVYGFNAQGSGWSPALNTTLLPPALPGSDVLVLRTTRQGMPMFRLAAPLLTNTDNLQVDGPAGAVLPVGATMIVSDCMRSTAFVVTGFSPGSPAVIFHGQGGGPPANVTASLINPLFKDLATVTPIDTVIYYVGQGTNGPALWRRIGKDDAVLLVEGVENLQVLYGEDTKGELLASRYVNASAVTNWDNIVSVTISVLLRSEDEANLDRDTAQYTMLDATIPAANDRRQRSLFTTTATLRNRSR